MKKFIAILGSLIIIAGVVCAIIFLLPKKEEQKNNVVELADIVATKPRNERSWLESEYIKQNAESKNPNFVDGKNISGSGIQSDPYKVYTGEGLAYFAYLTSTEGGNTFVNENTYIELANDIDLADYYWYPISANSLDNKNLFYGNFDGKNFKIYGLFVEENCKYSGLFGYISQNAVIKNVNIVSGEIVAGNQTVSVGAVVAKSYGATIENCHNQVDINSNYALSAIGGVVGSASNTKILNCSNDGNINQKNTNNYNSDLNYGVGGVVGVLNGQSNVSNSYNIADINAEVNVGGIVGSVSSIEKDFAKIITIENVYNEGNITGKTGTVTYGYVAGVVGYTDETTKIAQAYNRGIVNSSSLHSGIANIVYSLPDSQMKYPKFEVSNVFNIGEIVDNDNAWGLVYVKRESGNSGEIQFNKGYNGGDCLSAISSSNIESYPFVYLNDLKNKVLTKEFMTNADYWTTSQAWSSFRIFSAHYPAIQSALPNSWIYYSTESLQGNGSENSPYQISSGADFGYVAGKALLDETFTQGKYFKVTNDIDLAQHQFTPIGTQESPFMGIFDGGNKIISNMFIYSNDSYTAMFAAISNYNDYVATIKNVNIDKLNFAGTSHVASLVADMKNGEISNCSISGQIIANSDYIGGVVAYMRGGKVSYVKTNLTQVSINGNNMGGIVGMILDGDVKDCQGSGIIYTTSNNVGGIAGNYAGGTVRESFANVELYGNQFIGGVVGYIMGNATTIKNCGVKGKIVTSAVENVGGIAGNALITTNILNCFAIVDIEMPNQSAKSVGTLYGGEVKAASVRGCYVKIGIYNNDKLVGNEIKKIFLAEDEKVDTAFENYFSYSEIDGLPAPKTMCDAGLNEVAINVANALKGYVVEVVK